AGQVLLEHGPRQFYRDGFCVEQATGYHFFTLGFLAHALATSRRIGEPLEELQPLIARAFSAGAAFIQPDGLWPEIGDVDSARSLPVLPENFWDFSSLYGLGAVLCERTDFSTLAAAPGAELYWLEGAAGIQQAADLLAAAHGARAASPGGEQNRAGSSMRTCRLRVPADAGYAIRPVGEGPAADWLLFDCGPIADGLYEDGTPSTAHGHADVLQVLLHLRGKPVLVDSGMPFYFGPRDWVDHFRGASAHTTVEIEGLPVVRHSGRLGWSHVSKSMQLAGREDSSGVIVSGRVH